MGEPEPEEDQGRSLGSRLLSGLDRWTSRAMVAVVVLSAALIWVLISIAVGFPARWETVFQTLVAALTLAMVFIIQHTQSRQQAATQRKLDEILKAPGFPSNRGDFGCGDHGRDGAGLGAPAPGRGRLGPARFSCSEGPQGSPGSRAARRAVARSAMRSTLEAGVAGPYP